MKENEFERIYGVDFQFFRKYKDKFLTVKDNW